eukprot:gene6313-6795_t
MFRSRLNLKSFVTNGKKFFSTDVSNQVVKYPGSVQFFHWTMGGSLVAAVGFVLAAQNTKDKKEKGDYMFYHKSFGLLAFGLLGPRLLVRLTSKVPGAVVGANAVEAVAGKLGHLAMYSFAIFLPVSGVVMGAYSGFGLPFFYTTLPSISKEPAIAKQAYELHKIAGQIFEYLIPIHVGGAFYHVFRGHTIFGRILPGLSGAAKTAPKVK